MNIQKETEDKINRAFDNFYRVAKAALEETGVDSTHKLDPEKAEQFMKNFEERLDK